MADIQANSGIPGLYLWNQAGDLPKIASEIFVFRRPHLVYFTGGFVFIPTEVQDSMKYHAVKLLAEGRFQVFSIVPYAIKADIYFSIQRLTGFRERKAEDISIKIVFKELPVQAQEIVIAAKNDIQPLQPLLFFFKDGGQK